MANKGESELVFGIRPVQEAQESGRNFAKIFVLRGTKNDQLQGIMKKARGLGIPVQQVPKVKLDNLTRKNHQGVVGIVSPIPFQNLWNLVPSLYEKGKTPFFLFLDKVTDVRNFGAVSRTAECLDVDAIILPSRGSALLNSDAVRTSAGALNHLPVCRVNDGVGTLRDLQDHGVKVMSCTEKGKEPLFHLDLSGPVVMVLGSEEEGIATEILEISDEWGKIPMKGQTASLNVSVASGMALYECVRQRQINSERK